jgi:redox-sensitive bicupin YhaK (pirin superfamily)
MSAGTGLTHSEFNLADTLVHFYQIWIFPDISGLEPSYDQKTYDPSHWKNQIFPVASGPAIPNTVTFHTDATVYRTALTSGCKVTFDNTVGRRIFLYLTSGQISVNDRLLQAKDQARANTDTSLILEARKDAELILIDVPSCKGWGYSKQTLRGAKR